MSSTNIPREIPSSGFFTKQIWLQGQTLKEIENRIGFHSGRLKDGCLIGVATALPGPDDFEFAGYSQVAEHHTARQYGNINQAKNKSEADAQLKSKLNLIASWSLQGSDRLIKVFPGIRHSANLQPDFQYPPGSGIQQWKLKKTIVWKIIAKLERYPDEIFIPNEGFQRVKYV
jgi:hypothetical protein